MDEMYGVVFGVCGALLAVEILVKFFPDNSGELIRGIAVLMILAVLVRNVLQTDFEFEFQFSDADTIEPETVTDMAADQGIGLLRERLYRLLDSTGIELEGGENGVEVLYRQSEEGEITIERVCVSVRYASDTDRAYAVLKSVLTDAIPIEVYKP